MSIITTPITYKQGSGGLLEFTIYDGKQKNDTPLDISGSTVMFYAVCKEDPTKQFYGNMTVINATLGQVTYEIQAADFPVIGQYECEIVIDIGQPLPIKAGNILIICEKSLTDYFEDEGGV